MYHTIFDSLVKVLISSHSANAILYYIENHKWFNIYKWNEPEHPHLYFRIPYKVWCETTLIPFHYIEALSHLIHPNNGNIYYEKQGDTYYVMIEASSIKPFKSRTPREHIIRMCHKYKKTHVLIKYLEEFYSMELRHYHFQESFLRYDIDYRVWNDLFHMTPAELLSISKIAFLTSLGSGDL
jgi:hypothetical protein